MWSKLFQQLTSATATELYMRLRISLCNKPCGGGFQYLHRTPASHRTRLKGIPAPGGNKYGDLALGVGKTWS
jgi:hypothetical protein